MANGFNPITVSAAADQLRVFQQAMRFPVFAQIVSMANVTPRGAANLVAAWGSNRAPARVCVNAPQAIGMTSRPVVSDQPGTYRRRIEKRIRAGNITPP